MSDPREQRLRTGHALAELVRQEAARREQDGRADELWALLMRWAEAAAEEEVALGVPDAQSRHRVLEYGDRMVAVLQEEAVAAESRHLRELVSVWRALQ